MYCLICIFLMKAACCQDKVFVLHFTLCIHTYMYVYIGLSVVQILYICVCIYAYKHTYYHCRHCCQFPVHVEPSITFCSCNSGITCFHPPMYCCFKAMSCLHPPRFGCFRAMSCLHPPRYGCFNAVSCF